MLKKSFFSILIILGLFSILIFLSACARGPSGPFAPAGFGGFVGGPDALIVSVVDGAPPDVIQDEGLTPFQFIINLENAGEAPVGPGTNNPLVLARLTGIMYPSFGLTEQTAVQTLDISLESAKRTFNGGQVPGEMNFITFDNLAYVTNIAESYTVPIRAEVCYDYENFATTEICMKNDILEVREDASICTLRGPKPVANSGGPIHVTAVTEGPVNSDTIQLNFLIEHVGRGVFFARSPYTTLFEPCSFDDANPDMFMLDVFVEPIEDNEYEIDCLRLDGQLPGGGAYGTVRMYMGAPLTISCFVKRLQTQQMRVYKDILNIRFEYRYGEYFDVPVFIQGHPW